MYEVEQLIAGQWGTGAAQRWLTVTDPADDSPVSRAPVATPADVEGAVKCAREASREWARTAPAARAAALHAAADAVAAAADHLAELVTREMGKPIGDARGGVAAGVGTLRQYAELGPLHRGRLLAGGFGATDLMVYEPRGVVAAITPWNDPVAVSCGLLGAALVTGNAVVYKPSERTPAAGHALARLLAAHLPPGVLSLVTGDGAAGAALAGADVDVVAHVGSTETGRSIAAACALSGAKALLENGGSDPLIVAADVDPGWAAGQAALGAFANAGQICVAVERIYVLRAVAEPFIAELAERAAALTMGPGMDPGTDLGPLVDRRLRDAVHAQVAAAMRDGARPVTGGEVPDGSGAFYPATVLTACTDDMAVVREETFGPVAPVVVVDDFDEALTRAARSPYGLAATVLTGSMANAQRAWRELPVGTVKVNSVFGGAPGGAAHPRRGSGSGYGYGPELLDEMTATKAVHIGVPG
ncbi:aldehyde dehydrogenase family protein [Rhizomonospora bruguierae]|uniref:aldehyde dehydrogenase family protein n=1 Tax=Rhizomonospora bruguierae TaxID=1581705 RepID=UPI001BCBE440|nr:aldehyde dehydrogenase family protein [Micromonospora sp. NBRC 107566]